MAILHLVNSEQALAECLSVAAAGDSVLLLGNAAVRAAASVNRTLLVLEDDLPPETLPAVSVMKIGYAEFVELATTHQPIVTWR